MASFVTRKAIIYLVFKQIPFMYAERKSNIVHKPLIQFFFDSHSFG